MTVWIDAAMAALVLMDLVLLASSRFRVCIRAVAGQGAILGALILCVRPGSWTAATLLLAGIVVFLKGVLFPRLLLRALREAEVQRELSPFVGPVTSLLAGILALAIAVWVSGHLPALPTTTSTLAAPVALATIFIGLFLVVSRRLALAQVVGYLVIENGASAFGIVLVREIPLLVELGMLLDAFALVFIMGIAIYHIRREFDHVDAGRLRTLRG